MKTLSKKINQVLVLLSLLTIGLVNGQTITGKSSKTAVNGTSPMHDWVMTSGTSTFVGTVSGNAIENAKFVIAGKTLKSTKGSMMDNKAYKALKSDKQPNITFTAASLPVGKTNVSGKLTIAGVTKTVTFPVSVVKSGNSYNVSGSINLKMSDFGMETPGFLGVHTGDAVTVTVNITAN